MDALCDDFERHWRRARRRGTTPPALDDFLARSNQASRAVLSQCLQELEFELSTGIPLLDLPGLRLEEEIGRGGMGVVYRARQLADGRAVALKLIPGAEHARWLRWLEELADLRHPNLVPLEAFGAHDGLHFIIMPLVDGGDLKEHLAEFSVGPAGRRTALRAMARLMEKVAGAVDFLHRRGILHRDLKPSNILLDSANEGEPLVCDFGLASRPGEMGTESSCVVGTPAYMAPEQKAGRPLTPAADIWSLGAVLHELLTRCVPGDAAKNAIGPGEGLTIDDELARICLRCLGHEVEARYASAADLVDDLTRYLEKTVWHE